MTHLAIASSLGVALLLVCATQMNGQTPVTERCSVNAGEPGANNTIVFRVQAGSLSLPPPQGLLVSSGLQSGLPFKFAFAETPSDTPNFLVISPSIGVTPGWVWVALNPNIVPYMAAPRTYAMTLRFSPTDEPDRVCFNRVLPIALSVLSPQPTVTSVVNSATLEPDVSPGTIISILGTNMSQQSLTARYDAAGLLPTVFGNWTLSFDGRPAPLLYVSPERIDALIPHSLEGQTELELLLVHDKLWRQTIRLPLQATSPGIFTASGSGGALGIYNQDGTPNGDEHPAPRGAEIQIRATGTGVWNEKLPDGSIALSSVFFPHYLKPLYPEVILRPQAPVSLTIGGQAAEIRSLGPVPYEIFGTLNIVAVVPEGIASGPQPVVLTVGENSNAQQQVSVVVQ